MNDAERFVRDEPELVDLYASNLPALPDLDLYAKYYALHATYEWPGWLGAVNRTVRATRRVLRWMSTFRG